MTLNHHPLAIVAVVFAALGVFFCIWVTFLTWKDYCLAKRHKMAGVPRVYTVGHFIQAIVRCLAALLLFGLAFLLLLQPLEADETVVLLRVWAVIGIAILVTVAGLHWRLVQVRAHRMLEQDGD
jgi:hypothetical protein